MKSRLMRVDSMSDCTVLLVGIIQLMIVSALPSRIVAEVPQSGLIASFPFDGNADDASGNGNHGTVFGAALTTDRFGIADGAYRFDGVDDYILANADNLPTASRSVSLWFLADRLDNRPGLLGYGGGSCGTSWLMGVNNGGGDRQYQLQAHCLVNLVRAGYGQVPVRRWHNWLMTTDATGTTIYIDGVEYASNGTFVSNTSVSGKDFAIGVAVSSAGVAPFVDVNTGYFKGSIDDVVIYDRSLDASEIQDVLAGELPSGEVLHYSFSGSASDESGNGNDGFVIGAVLTEDRFGSPDAAYSFDGVDDYIRADASSLPTGERTVSFWFQADSVSTRPVLLGYGGGVCGTSWLMGINNGGADNQYQMQGHCSVSALRAGYSPAPVLEWKHWVITTDPSGTRFFVDGKLNGSSSVYVENTSVAGRDLAFGVITSAAGTAPYVDVNTGYLDGKLDDVYIYNRALSVNEVTELFYDGVGAHIFSDGFESGDASAWTIP